MDSQKDNFYLIFDDFGIAKRTDEDKHIVKGIANHRINVDTEIQK